MQPREQARRLHWPGRRKSVSYGGKAAVQGGWMCSQPHNMILGKMKQCGAQANAARCNGLRSVLQRATQRTAFVASPFCRAHCIRYAKTIHPARCIRPFTFEWPRSRIPKSQKKLKREMHCIADLTEAHRPGMPTDLGRRRKEYHPFSPSKHPRSPGCVHRPLQKAPRMRQAE